MPLAIPYRQGVQQLQRSESALSCPRRLVRVWNCPRCRPRCEGGGRQTFYFRSCFSRRLFSQASIAAPTALLADSSRTARFAGFSPTALCRWRGVGRYIQLRETQNTEKQKRAFDAVKTTDPRLHQPTPFGSWTWGTWETRGMTQRRCYHLVVRLSWSRRLDVIPFTKGFRNEAFTATQASAAASPSNHT